MTRSGIVCAGSWMVDVNCSIRSWPEEQTLATIVAQTRDGGGPAHNVAVDLARLDPALPLWGMGAIGDDEAGRHLLEVCARHRIEATGLRCFTDAATAQTYVMTDITTGRRTFFHHQGANARLRPGDLDFGAVPARWLHLGAPGLHERLDDGVDGGWAAVLQAARWAGLRTNLDVISTEPEHMRERVRPCLPHLDSLVINDYEAAALTGLAVMRAGRADVAVAGQAARALQAQGPALVVVHFPEGCVAATADGRCLHQPSLRVPPDAVQGSNGAGDAFTAGLLLALHEGLALDEGLRLAACASAAALRSLSATGAVGSREDCMALAEVWGWRSAADEVAP